MAERAVVQHGLYRHFKGELYRVFGAAFHTETGERLILYYPLKCPREAWARPFDDFVSEVDREKYPDVTQKYRFELVEEGL